MPEKEKKLSQVCKGPFGTYFTYDGKSKFDKYYFDISEKEVFKDCGEKDEDGNALGVVEKKFIVKKVDIHDFLESQRDTVGVESYIKTLSLQGVDINEMNTAVDSDIHDFSQMPEDLAGVILSADNARKAFANLDPALKGDHSTIEGFLNSLTSDSIDNYIKGKIEALMPSKKEEVE